MIATALPYDVLLVEDDDADVMLIEEALLTSVSERCITRAVDGIDALACLRGPVHYRPDLIVLDLNMPRMNGRELLAVLKDDADLCSIPVIVLTTSDAPRDIVSAYQNHVNAYITKPVDFDDFVRVVSSMDAFFLQTAALVSHPGAHA